MPKTPKTRDALNSDYIGAMRKESDRGAVLVAAAYIDDSLEELLVGYFVEDKKVTERILSYPGPCSTLASRCDFAYCLGLFGKDVYEDIRTIIKIRNQFAHSKESAAFERQDISDLCRQLGRGMKEAGTDLSIVKPRSLFLISAGWMILALVGMGSRISHRKPGPVSKDIPRPNINPLGY
jgi:DNA-binding MltR family transcriptional regulator